MNVKWILLPVLVVAAAGVTRFSLTHDAACRAVEPELDRLRDVSFLRRTLQLSDEQSRDIEVLQSDLGVRLMDCCARHCAARKRLGQAFDGGTLETDRMEALVAEMCAAYAESERLTLEHIRRVRDLLDSEQRRRFDELVIDALLCKDCPACGTETRNPSRGTIHGDGSHGNATFQRGSENEDARLEPGAPTGHARTQSKREHS